MRLASMKTEKTANLHYIQLLFKESTSKKPVDQNETQCGETKFSKNQCEKNPLEKKHRLKHTLTRIAVKSNLNGKISLDVCKPPCKVSNMAKTK